MARPKGSLNKKTIDIRAKIRRAIRINAKMDPDVALTTELWKRCKDGDTDACKELSNRLWGKQRPNIGEDAVADAKVLHEHVVRVIGGARSQRALPDHSPSMDIHETPPGTGPSETGTGQTVDADSYSVDGEAVGEDDRRD